MSRHKPLWIELADGHSAAVGVLRRGRRGFFVLGRRTYGMASRPIVASGHFENGRAVIFDGVLSTAAVSELEQKLRSQQ